MRTLHYVVEACSLAVIVCTASTAAAGPLTPPAGPITSSYKTITDAEPRTAISSTNTPGDTDSVFRITQPGSYYLTDHVTGASGKSGIEIDLPASGGHVNIDLGGFTLRGVSGSLHGIASLGTNNPDNLCLVVSRGAITGWGGAGVNGAGGVWLDHVDVHSGSASGCVVLAATTARPSRRITNCTFETTAGPALAAMGGCVSIDGCTMLGEGCVSMSFIYDIDPGCPLTMKNCTIGITGGTFSSSAIRLADTAGVVDLSDVTMQMTTTNAASAVSIGGESATVRGLRVTATNCAFTGAAVDVNPTTACGIFDIWILLTGTTTAPAALRVSSGNGVLGNVALTLAPGVPVGIELVGANNELQDAAVSRVPAGGAGVRVLGAANSVKRCRVSGLGVAAFTGVELGPASAACLVVNNEFVRLAGGVAINNLGAPSNGIGPMANSANLGAATSPFANVQH